jgi:hypothetical protein
MLYNETCGICWQADLLYLVGLAVKEIGLAGGPAASTDDVPALGVLDVRLAEGFGRSKQSWSRGPARPRQRAPPPETPSPAKQGTPAKQVTRLPSEPSPTPTFAQTAACR